MCWKRMIIQRVGDRGGQSWSIKDHAFTIPANPMSDRVQLVIEIYEAEYNPHRSHLEK